MIRNQLLAVVVMSMWLVACGNEPGGGGARDGGGPSATIDVQGRVVGPTGVVLSGLSVGIGQKTAVADSDGRFSIDGVVPPYDLNVESGGTSTYVARYEGLTRPDPTISFLPLFSTGEPNTATIAGTVSGGEPIGAAGLFTIAFFTTPDVRFDLTSIGIHSGNNPFTLPVSWFGPQAISGTVHVLQFTAPQPGDPPTAYTGYGTHSALPVARDGALTGADVALTAPGNASIDGTIVPPDGYRVQEKTLGLEVSGLTALPIAHIDNGDTGFTFTVPEGIPASAAVTVNADGNGAGSTSRRVSGISPGPSGISISLLAPAQPVAPDDGALVSAGTPVTWNPLEHAVHVLMLTGGPYEPAFYIVTGAATVQLPELPSGSTYQWSVAAIGPFDGIDAFTGGANFFPALGDSFRTVSATRSFVVR
jgi:hypothetical protein